MQVANAPQVSVTEKNKLIFFIALSIYIALFLDFLIYHSQNQVKLHLEQQRNQGKVTKIWIPVCKKFFKTLLFKYYVILHIIPCNI